MSASLLSFRAAVLILIAGMIWGIYMGITRDHAAMPAHAHLNLLGFAALFLFGIYYRLHPALDRSQLALAHVWIWIVASIVLAIGVGLLHTGHEIGDPIAAVSSIVVFLDTLLFAWLLFRREAAQVTP
jgi:hypothetical protein